MNSNNSSFLKKKIVLGIEYIGNNYHGWQRQKGLETIQEFLEIAIKNITNENIQVFCAGRTDAGVHALGQVIHFETSVFRNENSWLMGLNKNLPLDISVRWFKYVSNDFHARYSAISRRYFYIILNSRSRSAILSGRVTFFHKYLDVYKMNLAAKKLIGEKNFSCFRNSGCQSISTYRTIEHIRIIRYLDFVVIDIKANSFMYKMVRNIVGCLLEIGISKKNVNWLSDILIINDKRKLNIKTAIPDGLYLVSIEYPEKYKIPKFNESYFFKFFINLNFYLKY